jgi:hypothetical protein
MDLTEQRPKHSHCWPVAGLGETWTMFHQELGECFALFAEAAVFFTLQEPEMVSHMGYIGKYLRELFADGRRR